MLAIYLVSSKYAKLKGSQERSIKESQSNTPLILYFDFNLILFTDPTDKEAREQLLEEIELMKAIGSHPNVVSMLGFWDNTDPIFLLLEYIPYGDLLNWLRNKRTKVRFLADNCQ